MNQVGLKTETWMHRITSESNIWLNAIKMEDEGNFLEASFLYLKDTAESIEGKFFAKAALSCSCAANCLSIAGNLAAARRLYLQTATIYELNGDLKMGESVREAIWSYKESYEYYNLACESEKTQIMYEKYLSLARRINPFLGEAEAMNLLRQRGKSSKGLDGGITQVNLKISAQVDNAMENVSRAIESLSLKKTDQRSSADVELEEVNKLEKSLTG